MERFPNGNPRELTWLGQPYNSLGDVQQRRIRRWVLAELIRFDEINSLST